MKENKKKEGKWESGDDRGGIESTFVLPYDEFIPNRGVRHVCPTKLLLLLLLLLVCRRLLAWVNGGASIHIIRPLNE